MTASRTHLKARVEALQDHSVNGYEWECNCDSRELEKCAHYQDGGVVSRAEVLALIDDEFGAKVPE